MWGDNEIIPSSGTFWKTPGLDSSRISVSWKKSKTRKTWSTPETNAATVTAPHIVTFARDAGLHRLKTGQFLNNQGSVHMGYRSSNFFKIRLQNKAKKKKAKKQWDCFPKDIMLRGPAKPWALGTNRMSSGAFGAGPDEEGGCGGVCWGSASCEPWAGLPRPRNLRTKPLEGVFQGR